MDKDIIDTSEDGWQKSVVGKYASRTAFILRDGAQIGVDLTKSLWAMLRKSGLTSKEIMALLAGVGISGIGVKIVSQGIKKTDPKIITAIVAGGLSLTVIGALPTFYVLLGLKPKTVKATLAGIEVSF